MILLIMLGFHLRASAQLSSLHFRHLDISDGLSANGVNSICQDREGFLWIGTQSGLNRYDGKHFKIFRHSYSDSNSIASNICFQLCVDSADNIWVLSSYSVSCFDKQSGNFINYFLKDKSERVVSDPEIFKGMMVKENGQVLVSSARFGFLVTDTRHHRLVPVRFPEIRGSIQNKDKFLNALGAIWYHTDSSIFVSTDDGKTFVKALDKKNLPAYLPISALGLCHVSGAHYFFADGRGSVPATIVESNPSIDSVSMIHFSENFFTTFEYYNQDSWWVGFWGSGLAEYNPKLRTTNHYLHYKDDVSSVSNNLVKSLFTDRDNDLWIGTENGIDYCNPGRDKVFMVNNKVKRFEQLDISEVETMAEDATGKVWVGMLDYNSGATNGLICYDPKTSAYKSFTGVSAGPYGIWQILPEGEDLLLSTQDGLADFNIKTEKLSKKLRHPFPSEIMNIHKGFPILQKDHTGKYWLGIWRKGLLKFDTSTREAIYFNSQENNIRRRLTADLVYGLAVDGNNNIWVINLNNNVLEFIDNHSNEVTHIPVEINGQSFSDKFHCITSDHLDNIWIGTSGGGLIMYDTRSHQFHLFTTADGLPDEFVQGMRMDRSNRLWVLTSTGLVWIDAISKKIHTIDQHPLQISPVNGDDPMLLTRSGNLYIGTAHGFSYFDPDYLLLNEKAGLPIPTLFQKMDHSMYLSPSQKELEVFPKEENVSVFFVSPDMMHGHEIDYSYRLKGYEDHWQQSGNEGIAKFSKLPPGKYELQMRASFRGMNWDGKYSTILLTVIPAYYQTWWFLSLAILLLALFAAWIIYSVSTRRLRNKLAVLKQQHQVNDLRNRISNDIHDEIGAGLTRISIRSELAKQNTEATKNDYLEVLQNINRQSHELVNSLGEIVWTINPQQDKLDGMLAYFRHYINKFLEGLPLKYSIHFPENGDTLMVPPDIKRNLLLILKEALNNAVKHAQANHIKIEFELDKLHYVLRVADDGKGLQEDSIHHFGNGMKGMKNRASLIHATLEVTPSPYGGTVVTAIGDFYEPG